jgi:hypothetical protein|eukprot:SAG25_NODE_130_length_14421_cov_71.473886_2_plen_59_part_00
MKKQMLHGHFDCFCRVIALSSHSESSYVPQDSMSYDIRCGTLCKASRQVALFWGPFRR